MKLIAPQLDLLLDRARALLDQLNFPSKDEYLITASTAIHDVRAASVSSWNLTYISFRPIFILLGILGQYLAVILRIIAKHSVAHGWIAAKEGYFQLRTATIWFIKFQRDLPLSAKYAELGVLALIIVLWLLRRHVKKHRYAERIVAWYREKKRRALRKYLNFVERVAKTSSFLAMLLPHLLYAVLVVGTKRLFPSVVTYLATRTYLCSIISFWHPLYLTFSVLGRLSHHLKDYKDDESSEENSNRTMTPSKLKQRQQREIEMQGLRVEAVDMLKYWVVYAVLLAIVRTGKLMPVIGHVLNVTADNASTPHSKGFFGKKSGLYTKLRLPGKFVEEVSLVFCVWLRLMPSSITGDSPKKQSASVSKAPGSKNLDKHGPVDILYGKLSPIVLSAMNSSAFIAKRALGESRDEGSTFMSVVIQKLQSFLDLFVMVRLISKESQQWLITTIVESSALLPAATTLLMPSYFTNYGVIYVSLIVPAGYSISSCNAIRNSSTKLETMMPKTDDASRYLQFWMVHAALSLLLASLAPLLAWIPLSTHVTWLIWAYVQLESSTRKIYGWFESELGKKSLDDTAIARSTRRIMAALPSNVEHTPENPDEATNVPVATGEKSKVA
mmetsp:Transcript_18502/g.40047  ORF Transcript_18502/g.40047 Transcript_18502/m.40047 type:complete len:614 (-) Transcript_18502:1307-3148(-)|eukprot:CAMPEP_0172323910 /NCGR_PEP_ID=MMETSP1058-20130122/49883_1 /TAXON_ID=83371 /ORGANISM="Detonula confervacea, Strain CCMP 353" /LENGTH=613 /DNA_ID=CAMNT_0013040029 /DNA_START=167 /DNA_END=2008 /DNA_ORIENTATION=+